MYRIIKLFIFNWNCKNKTQKKAEIEFSNSNQGGALVEIIWKNSDLVNK